MKLVHITILLFAIILMGCVEATHDPVDDDGKGKFGKLENNFQSIFANIIQPKCVECHSGSNAPHNIHLSSYEEIVNGSAFPPLIVPGKPNESSLYKSVLNGSMPKNRPRLSETELVVLYNWIRDGALKKPGEKLPPDDDEPPNEDEPPDDNDNGSNRACNGDEPCD